MKPGHPSLPRLLYLFQPRDAAREKLEREIPLPVGGGHRSTPEKVSLRITFVRTRRILWVGGRGKHRCRNWCPTLPLLFARAL